jgi:hypothetical protein
MGVERLAGAKSRILGDQEGKSMRREREFFFFHSRNVVILRGEPASASLEG